MSSVYTPSATIHGSYVLPSDGDPAVAESVNDALRDLADGVLNANAVAASAVALAGQMINGVTGGSYAPSSAITLTSKGIILQGLGANLVVNGLSTISVTGVLSVSTSLMDVTGALVMSGATFTVGSGTATDFNGPTRANDTMTIAQLIVNGNSSIGNSASDLLNVEADSTFSGPVAFDGAVRTNSTLTAAQLIVNGNSSIGNSSSDGIALVGTTTLHEPMQYTGNGRVPLRRMALPDASSTVSVSDGNCFDIPLVTGSRVYTMSTDGAEAGDFMLFFSGRQFNLPNQVIINSFATGEDTLFPAASIGPLYSLYVFAASDWYCAISSV